MKVVSEKRLWGGGGGVAKIGSIKIATLVYRRVEVNSPPLKVGTKFSSYHYFLNPET